MAFPPSATGSSRPPPTPGLDPGAIFEADLEDCAYGYRPKRSALDAVKATHDGGKGNRKGTPQGGVISPLLANLYMNRFLKHWRTRGCGAEFRAHLVNYADDFVVLSCGHSAEPWRGQGL